jgi:hypothetical protein
MNSIIATIILIIILFIGIGYLMVWFAWRVRAYHR